MELDTLKTSQFVVGIVGLILLPLGFIWATNTIFTLGIEYTFTNWLSVLFIQVYLQIIIKASTLHLATAFMKK